MSCPTAGSALLTITVTPKDLPPNGNDRPPASGNAKAEAEALADVDVVDKDAGVRGPNTNGEGDEAPACEGATPNKGAGAEENEEEAAADDAPPKPLPEPKRLHGALLLWPPLPKNGDGLATNPPLAALLEADPGLALPKDRKLFALPLRATLVETPVDAEPPMLAWLVEGDTPNANGFVPPVWLAVVVATADAAAAAKECAPKFPPLPNAGAPAGGDSCVSA